MVRKIILYFAFVLLFVVEKPLFMLYHFDIYGVYPLSQWLAVMWNGLPHDLTVAGYLSAIPFLLSIVGVWAPGRWQMVVMRWYLRLILIPVLLIFFVDLELYTHWGFRLDSTPLIYLSDNPGDAIANAPTWALVVFPLLLAGVWWSLQRLLNRIFTRPTYAFERRDKASSVAVRCRQTVIAIFLCAVLFVPIRGGLTVSTMNVGRVYFSKDMKLNHAAINPMFSFFASVAKTEDFGRQYRFMSDAEAAEAMAQLAGMSAHLSQEASTCDSLAALPADENEQVASATDRELLTTRRPNIVVVILESFSGSACAALTPEADVQIMPSINRFYDEGIGFMQFYANSFRTDRGVAAVLASYPGQPTNSIMKQPTKTQHLQYMSGRMGQNGYDLEFVHGGDADFTNMRSFLMAGGIEHITADVDFPLSERLSKWGVPDDKVFNYLYGDVVTQAAAQSTARQAGITTGDGAPFMKVFLTLSSHEPFDVPFSRFSDLYLNSVAYTDSCLGNFVDRLKATPYWDDLLIIGLPDHCFAKYPATIMNHEPLRYHIPMFWVGGAVRTPRRISVWGSQIDLAATLLGQLGMSHDDFNFSKDLMDDTLPHYAFYAWPDGFGFLTDSVSYIQDNANNGQPLSGSFDPQHRAEHWGKAYLQTLYDDLNRR